MIIDKQLFKNKIGKLASFFGMIAQDIVSGINNDTSHINKHMETSYVT